MQRCGWVTSDHLYQSYHDNEWGTPQTDGKAMFEMLCLEGQQAGLSWITVLKKRENYRLAFKNFDPYAVASMSDKALESLMQNNGLIRYRGKLAAIINNARAYLTMEAKSENFSQFIWSFVNHQPQINHVQSLATIKNKTIISDAMSNALKLRGFKFIGSTTCYAFMQACGLVNDHVIDCFRHPESRS